MANSTYTNIAFISYKREDEAWAKWLQKQLEYYKLPTEIRKNPEYEFSESPRHVFRDTTDLSGGILKEALKEGLDSSKFLIVICSPRAARSEWVCKEVLEFIDSGRREKIIPLIVEGQPYAENAKDECFPEALRKLKKEQQPLGISIKENGREMAVVKVVARLFDLAVDSLWQRFKREEAQKRKNMLRLFSIFISIILLFPLLIAASYFSTGTGFHSPMSEFVGKSAVDTIMMSKDSYYVGNLHADTIVIKFNKNHKISFDRCQDVKCFIINSDSCLNDTINNIHIYNCNALNEIWVNTKIRRIDWPFVDNCPSLKKIVLPRQLKEIQTDAINHCNINEILFPCGNDNFVWKENCLWNVEETRIVYANFSKRKRLERSDEYKDSRFEVEDNEKFLYIPFPKEMGNTCSEIIYDSIHVRNTNNSQYSIRYGVLYNYMDVKAEEINIPNNVKKIKVGAFNSCKKLKRMTINDRINFDKEAFKNNATLENLEINAGGGDITISESAFEGAKLLKKVVIKSAGLVNIKSMAFFSCPQLNKIEIDCNVIAIDNYALQDCPNLKTLQIKFKDEIQLCHYISNLANNLSYNIINDSIKTVKCKEGKYYFYRNKFLCHDGNIKYHKHINKNDSIPCYSEDGILIYRDGSLSSVSSYAIKESIFPLQQYMHNTFLPGRNLCTVYNNSTDTELYLPPIATDKYFLSSPPKDLKQLHIPVVSPSRVLIYDIMKYISDDCILYVPYGTSKAYQEDGRYYAFKEIREDSFISRVLNVILYQYYSGKLVVTSYINNIYLFMGLVFIFIIYISYCYYKLRKWNMNFQISPIKSIFKIIFAIIMSTLILSIMIAVWFITYWGIYNNLLYNNLFINGWIRIITSNVIAIPFSYILTSFILTGEKNLFKYGYFDIKQIIATYYRSIIAPRSKQI